MLILNPDRVRFAGQAWPVVTAVMVDRSAERLVESWADMGPYAVLVDVAEQRVTIRVTLALSATDLPGPELGAQGLLEVWTSPTASAAQRVRVAGQAVITGVRHEMGARGVAASAAGAGMRVVTLAAVSDDGKLDPLFVASAEVGPD